MCFGGKDADGNWNRKYSILKVDPYSTKVEEFSTGSLKVPPMTFKNHEIVPSIGMKGAVILARMKEVYAFETDGSVKRLV